MTLEIAKKYINRKYDTLGGRSGVLGEFVSSYSGGDSVITRYRNGTIRATLSPAPLKIYAQNMAFLPLYPFTYKGKEASLALNALMDKLLTEKPDIVGLSEMFVNQIRDDFYDIVKDVYPFRLTGPATTIIDPRSNGGLMLLSRHPFSDTNEFFYDHAAGVDALSTKGILHARISVPNHPTPYDIFLTHTQDPDATGEGAEHTNVLAQIQQLNSFIQNVRSASCPAMMMGDLNVDGTNSIKHTQLMQRLNNATDLWQLYNPGQPGFTFDSLGNTFLIDTIPNPPNARHTQGQRLDYIMMWPTEQWIPIYERPRVIDHRTDSGRDMSDHYGIMSEQTHLVSVDVSIQARFESVIANMYQIKCIAETPDSGSSDEVYFQVFSYTAKGEQRIVESPLYKDIDAGDKIDINPPISITLSHDDITGGAPLNVNQKVIIFLAGKEDDSARSPDLVKSDDDNIGLYSYTFSIAKLLQIGRSSGQQPIPGSMTNEGSYQTSGNVFVRVIIPPHIDAGTARVINNTLPTRASVTGRVIENGLPDKGQTVTSVQWSLAQGPVSAAILSPNQLASEIEFKEKGRYQLKLQVENDYFPAQDDVWVTVNTYPKIEAGQNQTVNSLLPASANLAGQVLDTGLADPHGTMAFQWTQVAGPPVMDLGFPDQLNTIISLREVGVYTLRLTANNGYLETHDELQITVNTYPELTAGPNQYIPYRPGKAFLHGMLINSGLADADAEVQFEWTLASGPGEASFADAHALETSVEFSQGGTYILRLTADNGYLSSHDEIEIIRNTPPKPNTGPDQTIYLPACAPLRAGVWDDGLPNPPGNVTLKWSKVSGPPHDVRFSRLTELRTGAHFTAWGEYVLQLEAYDGEVTVTDTITIDVQPQAAEPAAVIPVTAPPSDPEGAGFILFQVHNGHGGIWGGVQWQDDDGDWHEVETWHEALEHNPAYPGVWYKYWGVFRRDIDSGEKQGTYRCVVYEGQQGALLATSKPFHFPQRPDQILNTEATLD